MDANFLTKIHKELRNFQSVRIPRFNEAKIQSCALSHLALKSMFELRDRFEGQKYYDKLRLDIMAELAFEQVLSLGTFDWDRRHKKNYERNSYQIQGYHISLINFSSENRQSLKYNPADVNNAVFIYIKPRNYLTYICGLATKKILLDYSEKSNQVMDGNSILEFTKFNRLIQFNSIEGFVKGIVGNE